MASEITPGLDTSLDGLRIDPTVRQSGGYKTIWWIGLVLVLALLIAGVSLWLYQATLGRPVEVQMAFARIVGAGAPISGPVLSGAGYVVTGDRYISIGVRVPGR